MLLISFPREMFTAQVIVFISERLVARQEGKDRPRAQAGAGRALRKLIQLNGNENVRRHGVTALRPADSAILHARNVRASPSRPGMCTHSVIITITPPWIGIAREEPGARSVIAGALMGCSWHPFTRSAAYFSIKTCDTCGTACVKSFSHVDNAGTRRAQ